MIISMLTVRHCALIALALVGRVALADGVARRELVQAAEDSVSSPARTVVRSTGAAG